MAGHFDLRDDGDESRGGIGDDLADVVLRVEAAVGCGVKCPFAAVAAGVADDGFFAPGADVGEAGVFFDFDAPALIFGQVPVKDVHLVHGQQVDVFFDELFGHKVAADIEVHAAPWEAGIVRDADAGDRPGDVAHLARLADGVGQQLTEGLAGVKEAVVCGGLDKDGFGRYRQTIAFFAQFAGQVGDEDEDDSRMLRL